VVTKKASAGEGNREGIWREKLKQWRESNQSQAAFCKENGLSENSLSHWKRVISERDAKARSVKAAAGNKKRGTEKANLNDAEVSTSPPAFVRFAATGKQIAETFEADGSKPKESSSNPAIAAEIVDASTGRRLRIFNGADQATVATLLSALSAV
jgi:hypothetical protein